VTRQPTVAPRPKIPRVQRAYLQSTRALSAIVLMLGIALVVVAVANGGGPLSRGVVLGVLIALAGAGRLWLATRGHREDRHPE
jgi:hypothetical protein